MVNQIYEKSGIYEETEKNKLGVSCREKRKEKRMAA